MYKKYNTLVEFCTNGIETEIIAIIFHRANAATFLSHNRRNTKLSK